MTDRTERLEGLQQQLADQVAALVSGEDWARMLETAARFHRYSANNVMLIMCQRPDASRVAGYRTWQGLGRQVRRGERGITILAPCRYKVEDKETGDPRWVVRGFTTTTVFDVSQTDGEPLADEIRPALLEGEAPAGIWDALAKQVAAEGFMLGRCDTAEDISGANGVTQYYNRTVTVRADVDDAASSQDARTRSSPTSCAVTRANSGPAAVRS